MIFVVSDRVFGGGEAAEDAIDWPVIEELAAFP
jgi:hypothetical protein